MLRVCKGLGLSIVALLLTAAAGEPAGRSVDKQDKEQVVEITGHGPAVLWRQPEDIAARNLYYGTGGKQHAPRDDFYTFDKEDSKGSNPKFDVVDADGVKWKVKLGPEARPETVASRLVWAVGYFADEDYFMRVLRLKDAPPRLHRGRKLITPDGLVYAARLKRSIPEKKIGTWQWMQGPFAGTRELNGLRVLMAVINNWDLKDENNAVLQADGPGGPQRLFEVSDLGASFGTAGFGWTKSGSRGNLKGYTKSKWIKHVYADSVDFNVPARPALDHFPAIHDLKKRLRLRQIGWDIPRQDARWMGNLLGQLSPQQIRDAFRAADYDDASVEGFSRVVERRIAELKRM
jgi:hypothetical protein